LRSVTTKAGLRSRNWRILASSPRPLPPEGVVRGKVLKKERERERERE